MATKTVKSGIYGDGDPVTPDTSTGSGEQQGGQTPTVDSSVDSSTGATPNDAFFGVGVEVKTGSNEVGVGVRQGKNLSIRTEVEVPGKPTFPQKERTRGIKFAEENKAAAPQYKNQKYVDASVSQPAPEDYEPGTSTTW